MSLVKRAMTMTRAMGVQYGSQYGQKPVVPSVKPQNPKVPVAVMRQRLAQRYGSGPAKVTSTMGRS